MCCVTPGDRVKVSGVVGVVVCEMNTDCTGVRHRDVKRDRCAVKPFAKGAYLQ